MADYIDVTLYDVMDEPAEISIIAEGGRWPNLQIIQDEEDEYGGWVKTFRVQLEDVKKL